MRTPLPLAPPGRLLHALTEPGGLRRWWDPEATLHEGRLGPGLDAPTLGLHVAGDVVTWEGEGIRARFDLAARVVDLTLPEGQGASADDRADLEAGWALALAGLAWALAEEGAVSWRRMEVPVALSYGDAWGRIVEPEGLAGPDASGGAGPEARRAVRIAGVCYAARTVVSAGPRAVALVLDEPDALVRLQIGPGESVNTARLDLTTRGEAPPPTGWEPWLARRFGMTWVTQLGQTEED